MNHIQYSDITLTNHVGLHDNHFIPQSDQFNTRIHFQTQNVVDKLGHSIIPQVMNDSCKYQLNTTLQGFDSMFRNNSIYINTKSESDSSLDYFKEQMKLGLSEKKNNYISSYNNPLLKTCITLPTNVISSVYKSKFMIDVGTMTDPLTPEEQERLCQWEGFAALQSGNKVAEYLTSLREFLKILPPSEGRKRQGLGDVRIVTAPDGSRFFCCSECHMAYPDKSALEQHLANHKIERRFICIVCGAGLKRKEHLDRHQLSHSDERPYTCDTCPKTFKRNEHLARHYIIHSGEKGQVCGECGKAFYRRDHLQKHAQGHITKRLRLAIQSSSSNTKVVL